MKIFRSEKGQVMIITVLAMTVLMGFMALAVDVGMMFRARRNMQIAADAAAMAGAVQLFYGPAANYQSVGYAAALTNGVDRTVTGNTVTVISPPTDGPNQGCSSCVEAKVGMPAPTVFMHAFSGMMQGNNFATLTVSARAVAGAPGNSQACVWLMDPTMDSELALKGKGSISATNCAIYLNSNSTSAVNYNGNTSVNASNLEIVGLDSGASGLDPGHVQIGVTPQSPTIPLNLPGIPSGGCTSTSTATEIYASGNAPKNPKATQVSDTSVSGSSTNNVVCFTNTSGVTIDGGVTLSGASGNGVVYVFEKGVSLGGAATFGYAPAPVNGQFDPTQTLGATLDIAGGSFGQGNAALSIYAPTSGTYNSIALMQPASNVTDNHCPASPGSPCLLIQRGNSGSTFDGIIYAPGEYVELQDQAGAVYATGLIAKGLFNKTSNLIINSYSTANPNTTPFKLVTMIE